MKAKNHQPNGPSAVADHIFYEAIVIENADERRAFVEEKCNGDPVVQREVDLLFASLENSEDFFNSEGITGITATKISQTLADIPEFFGAVKSTFPDDSEVGKTLGPYKLMQKIGEGGAGDVYLAEQSTPIRRQVALKIIKLGMDTKSVIARFKAEKQTLAMMEHPNIAHVLDAGETETGRPFFVMELLHGTKITSYSEDHSLDLVQRLQLLIQVCHAIQHAHQKGIIHRDIKPSNVMITLHDGESLPQVIDFGIAKATTDELQRQDITRTSAEPFIGTPTYMSPEQASTNGLDVDTRSDIYSLGVLLYELLIGSPPFSHRELTEGGIDEMCRILREDEPLRPSIKFQKMSGETRDNIARHRRTDPRKLTALLNGELDWITAKALEKDRSRRYETVEAFEMDLRRFLNNEPVLARPPSRRYRFCKLVKRNKHIFIPASMLGLTLIAWLATASWLLEKEKNARKRAVIAEHHQMQLRLAAEDRERATLAAFLISRDNLEEADHVIDTVSNLTPSLEAESVLRTLGKWHALNGRWQLAANRFKLLLKVDVLDNSWRITDDFLMAGPIFLEHGDIEGYEHFRRASLEMYQKTESLIFAERTLKACLLLPTGEELFLIMQPLADLILPRTRGDVMHSWAAAWSVVSLALLDYRMGDFRSAVEWCEESRTCVDKNPARDSISYLIQAMAAHKMGEEDSALAYLNTGRNVVSEIFRRDLDEGDGSAGYWYDWLYARILLREAETELEKVSN